MTLWVGLTGGIGSGKSSVAQHFARLGAPVIDADQIARALTAPNGKALPDLRRVYPPSFFQPDGSLDRNRIRDLVFRQPEEKKRLENLLHPLILEQIFQKQNGTPAGTAYGIVEIPLLAEQPVFRQTVGRIIVVDAPDAERLARVQARSGLDENTVRAIMAQQSPREARLSIADDIIDNSLHRRHLHEQVERLHRFYQALSQPVP